MKKFLCFALLIATVFTLASCGTKTVKVQDYIEVEFSPAYNGYAEPDLTIDTDGLNSMMDSKKTLKYVKSLMNSNEEYKEIVDEVMAALEEEPDMLPGFTDFFEINLAEDYEGLKNGDKVKVVIKLDSGFADFTDASVKDVAKKLGIKLSKTEFEVKVKGLEDLDAVNVNLDKLLNIDFGKYERYASPSIEIDYDYFSGLLIGEVVDDFAQKSKNNEVKKMLARDCEEWFTAEFDKAYDGLKNGDVIKVNIILDEVFTDCGISIADFEAGLALNLNGGTNVYAVEGLVEPENVLDIFEGIEQYIVYEGANGNGRIGYGQIEIPKDYSRQVGDLYFSKGGWTNSVKIVHNNAKIGEITYYIDGEKLSGGDVIEITTSCPTDVLEDLGYIVPTTRKNTTVPDLGEYMRSRDQLTPEVLTAVKDWLLAKAETSELNKMYFTSYKPGIECNYDSTAFFVGIYYKTGFFTKGYYIDELYDIIIKPDGSIEVETYEHNSWGYYDTLEKAIDALAEDRYDFIELN